MHSGICEERLSIKVGWLRSQEEGFLVLPWGKQRRQTEAVMAAAPEQLEPPLKEGAGRERSPRGPELHTRMERRESRGRPRGTPLCPTSTPLFHSIQNRGPSYRAGNAAPFLWKSREFSALFGAQVGQLVGAGRGGLCQERLVQVSTCPEMLL